MGPLPPPSHRMSATPVAPPAPWWREWLGGSLGSIAVIGLVLSIGLLATAPLGTEGAAAGVRAGLLTAVAGGAAYAWLGRAALPAAGPSSATALLLAALLLQLQTDPALRTAPALQLALLGVAVALSGVLQLAAAFAGLARLASYVPRPVVSGFMNGVALQVLLAQWPLLSGRPLGAAPDAAPMPLALLLGLGCAAAVLGLAHRWPRLPATLLVLAAGTLLHLAAGRLAPGLALGQTVGSLPTLLSPSALPLAGPSPWWPALQAHFEPVLLTALLLAGVGTLETALNAIAIDRQRQTRHDPRRELAAIGATNVLLGLLGALPATITRSRATATALAGGSRRQALIAGSLVLGALALAARPLLAALPLPVLGGLMLALAWALLDTWSLRLLRRLREAEARASLAVVLTVMLVTLGGGLGAGVALGGLLSLLQFVRRMNRSLVRSRFSAAQQPSRRMRVAALEAQLRPLRARVQVLELEGALFFGSGERLLAEADALPADCCALLLDAERVSTVDDSGLQLLQDLQQRLAARGVALRIAGLRPQIRAGWAAEELGATLDLDPDLDRALEWAEDRLLPAPATPAAALALADTPLLQALDAADRPALERLLVAQQLGAGERLFAAGDPGDRLYLLLSGSVSVLTAADEQGRSRRFLSLSPGTLLGETALLDGGGRSAGAVADCASTLVWLDEAALRALERSHPQAAARLYRQVAQHLSQRLRSATAGRR